MLTVKEFYTLSILNVVNNISLTTNIKEVNNENIKTK